MDFPLGVDGFRRRTVIGANAKKRTYKLCIGQGNTCTNDAKADGTCAGCKSGIYKGAAEERVEGEKFEENGERFIYTGGQRRKLCNGKDKTCEKLVRADGLCAGCESGKEKAPIGELAVGDIIERDGARFKYDGKQLRRLCSGAENTCVKFATTKGQCILHSNGGERKKKKQGND